jgi:WD40 repeat protein
MRSYLSAACAIGIIGACVLNESRMPDQGFRSDLPVTQFSTAPNRTPQTNKRSNLPLACSQRFGQPREVYRADWMALKSTPPGHSGPFGKLATHFSPIRSLEVDFSTLLPSLVDKARFTPTLAVQTMDHLPFSVADFSRDGKMVITAGGDDTARLWDTATGSGLRTFFGHSGHIRSVRISSDGHRVLTAGDDMTARIWDSYSGKLVGILVGHTSSVRAAAFSADAKWVITAANDGTVRVWDARTCKPIREFRAPNCSAFADISPDGNFLLTPWDGNKSVRIWRSDTTEVKYDLRGHSGQIYETAFSPDGRRVMAAYTDWSVGIWSLDTGRQILFISANDLKDDHVHVHTWDGKIGRAYNESGVVSSWDCVSGKRLTTTRMEVGDKLDSRAVFSYDGHHLLASAPNKGVILDSETGKIASTLDERVARVGSVECSPDGMYILTTSDRSKLRVWNTHTGIEGTLTRGIGGIPWHSHFSHDGKTIITSYSDGIIGTVNVASGKERQNIACDGDVFSAGFAISPDDKFVITAGADGIARIWDLVKGELVRDLKPSDDSVTSVAYSPDGRYALTGHWSGIARLWETSNGALIRTLNGHKHAVQCVAWSPDRRYVATGSWDTSVRLWNPWTGEQCHVFEGHTAVIQALGFSRSARSLLTGDRDGSLRLWETETRKSVWTLSGHAGWVNGISFSANGWYAVTAGMDGTTRLWDVGSGRALCCLISMSDGSWAVADSAGRFDASDVQKIVGAHWVMGVEPVSLSQMATQYHDSGLLAKYLGNISKPLRKVTPISSINLFPRIEVLSQQQTKDRLAIKLVDRGGGIGKVDAHVDGQPAQCEVSQPIVEGIASTAILTIHIPPRAGLGGEKARIRLIAWNADGSLCTLPFQLEWPTKNGSK